MDIFSSSAKYDVLMSEVTSMKVGGLASVFYTPSNEGGLIARASAFYKVGAPFILFGNGTNIIVRDGGYPGAVISTTEALRGIETGLFGTEQQNNIICGAGESLSKVCRFAAEYGLSGLEALSGIPGTVGGAVFMNAGAYGSEISDVLFSVRAFSLDDKKGIMLTNEECELSYRSSIFKLKPMIILSVVLTLKQEKREIIEQRMSEYTKKRNEKQPVNMPSAGSFFKRPEGHYAGQLIEEAEMKGKCVGGAKVSEKHAGFIVNTGNATANDVLLLSEEVKSNVYKRFNVKLEEEPIVIGV